MARVGSMLGIELPIQALFENPTIAQLAETVEAVTRGADSALPLRRAREPQAILSYAQEGVWVEEQLQPGSATYNVPMAVRAAGDLNVRALKASLNEIIRRHETLRTTFANNGGRPVPVIAEKLLLEVPVIDLSNLLTISAETAMTELLRYEARRAFDLERGPLVRALIVRMSDCNHVIALTLHHLVCDGWSAELMFRELSALYPALVTGSLSPLPELPVQYTDFAAWQRQYLAEDAFQQHLSYWQTQLNGSPFALELPTDHPRLAVNRRRGARFEIALDPALLQSLKALGREEGATLFMTLLAGFQMLLHRYSGQDVFLIGTPVANRMRLETQAIIGFLVNMLALRCDLRGEPTFRQLVARSRATVLEAHMHQDVPFQKLVEDLQPVRDFSNTPLFQATIVLQNAPPAIQMEGLTLERLNIDMATCIFDLSLVLAETGAGLSGTLAYNTDLFDSATIERLANHYQNLLRAAVEYPDSPGLKLAMLADIERQKITEEWNNTAIDYGTPACLQDRFDEQAERTPDAIAVSGDEGLITYGELRLRARQLANFLHAAGVGPESRVGICLYRSVEMVIALLGTVEAGAAYVPLDPSYPRERLTYMLEDGDLAMILTQAALLEQMPATSSRLLCLDRDWKDVAAYKPARPTLRACIDNVAYLIYTSGSTGKPKGVMNSHRGIFNHLRWIQSRYHLTSEDRLLQKTPFSFDVSVWEFFWPLLEGACLVMAKPDGHRDSAYLADIIAREQISVSHFVPAMLRAFLDEVDEGWRGSLRQVMCGGETLPSDLQQAFFERITAKLDNFYGPTEAAIDVTSWACRPGWATSVPIGRPISNMRIYILDSRGEPVPIGVAGELYIGGVGVARGYWRRAELTGARFVPDEFSGETGARLYGTGDLARYLPDGNIVFLGRLDHQVKIRGYRIELGEIESVLIEQETVGEAVVLARGETGQSQLVAYLVLIPGAISDLEQLRRYLRQRLPEYMIPSAIVILEALPLSPNGKVDRKALPAPSMIAAHGQPSSDKPYNQIEELLAGIWAEVLGVEEVGLKENFFDLGGHSLLATRVMSRIRQVFNTEVALRSLFEHPTIGELASLLHQRWQATAPDEPALRIQPAARGEQLQPSYGQERMWFLWKLQEGSAAYNVAGAVRLIGKLDEEALVRAIKEVVRRHEVLRTRYEDRDGKPEPVVGEETEVEIVVEEVKAASRHQAEAEVESRSRKEASRGFDLSRGPLMRVRLMKVEQGESVMVVVMHHIVSDGWSVGVLIREMGVLYGAYERGEEEALEELPIQYGDYAAWQRRWMQSPEMERQLNYWKSQLGGERAVAKLPTEKTRPARVSLKGASKKIELSAELTRKVKEVSRSQSATIYMVMMAALKVMMYRYSGEEQIAVGTVIANRMREETEGLIGFFVNTLVMKTDLGGNPSLREVIRREREVALGAYANQEIPFEKVVEEMQPERRGSETPMFEVMFVLQNTADERMEMGGVRVIEEKIEREMTKFELTLEMREVEGKLKGAFEYNTELYDESTMERMAAHFERILEQLAVDSDQKINQVAMLTEWEREQIIKEWNDTKEDYARDVCVQELIEREAKQRPEAVAVSRGDEQISYEELNRKANQLAGYLKEKGVGPEVLVGILVERSIEMVIGMLGVLKAGGAYVPLEATYPGERLAFMAEDSGMKVVLTSEKLEGCVERQRARIVRLERDWEIISRYSSENQPREVSPENLAYVIYTSGSTGRPKGVELTHRGLMNLVSWYQRAYEITANDRTSQLAAMGFDASVFELWPYLSAGASVHIVEDQTRVDVEKLIEWLNKKEITIGFLPTPIAEILMGEESAKRLKMRALIVGGDTLHRSAEEGVRFRLINHYGPTENTVVATCTEVKAGVEGAPAIGKPITNTEAYVLDRNEEPVAIGVIGELYLGGESLGRGYLRRAEMTAEKFIPNQFSEKGGERLYRSGDLVRYGRNGEIEFVGRSDDQVKIRGMRIEMGEIEGVIRGHERVKEAAVETIKGERGEKRIVAYVVGREEGKLEMREVEREVRRKLPEDMMPVGFVEMERLPLTPNGKVDRKALPAPSMIAAHGQPLSDKPYNQIEELLAGIWAEVLGVEEVGLKENFFELGGHSLLATRVMSRIRQVFNIEVALRALFEHPTISELAGLLHQQWQATAPDEPALRIQPAAKGEQLQPSYGQERMWFLWKLQEGSAVYNVAGAVRLIGKLDEEALVRAIKEVVRRHEVLRTRYEDRDGKPEPVVGEETEVEIVVEEVKAASRHQAEAEVESRSRKEASRGFDLSRGPLVRVRLMKVEEQESVMVVVMHHIVSDGWSVGVLIREMGVLYGAYERGEEEALEELPIQYGDYAAWQRRWMQSPEMERQLNYWKSQLGGERAVAKLPTEKTRPARVSLKGASRKIELSAELTRKVKEVSRSQSATIYMVMMAALKVMMYRYSGEEQIAVGTVIANRMREETEGLIGFFVNTLVMKTDLGGNPSLREVIRREREVALGAYANQEIPFEKVVEEMQPERRGSETPMFEVMFVLQNTADERMEMGGVRVIEEKIEREMTKFELTLEMREVEGKLKGAFEYNTELYDESTMERMAAQYERVVEAICRNCEQRVADIDLLSEREKHLLVVEWNETASYYPRHKCVHELFQEQVEFNPESVAVIFEDEQVTYRELNKRANQLAHYLQSMGVGPEVKVGICVDRSVGMIVGLLAILKAGAAYVPLDAAYPRERLSFMLDDAGIEVVITQEHINMMLPEQEACRRVFLDRDWRQISDFKQDNPTSGASSDNLAYVMYTSGSTGLPKGVEVIHKAVVKLVRAVEYANLDEQEVILQAAPLSFDASTFEVWGALINGASCVLLKQRVPTAEDLGRAIREKKVSTMWLTASLMNAVVDEGVQELDGLKQLLAGGEALSVEHVRKLKKSVKEIELINGYGPTEATTFTCTQRIGEEEADKGSVAIGRPIANTKVYVVDNHNQPVGIGVAGELLIGGEGLARGYLNRAELTAEKFIPETFSGVPGQRVYRTGDLARYQTNGQIEYLGRIDQQVKIRGYRVEMGEIEAAVLANASVRECVVVARETSRGDKQLVCYVTGNGESELSSSELKEHLRVKLPEYMIPAVYVKLEKIPLTSNGKVDRKALPAPSMIAAHGQPLSDKPYNQIEELLAGIWAEVLGVEEVGLKENFFDLGGHSLLATRVVSRIRQVFNTEVALRSLFEHPTIGELAGLLHQQWQATAPDEPALRIQPAAKGEQLQPSYGQERMWFLWKLQEGSAVYNVAGAVRLIGKLDEEALVRAIKEVVRRHEVLRTRYEDRDGKPEPVVGEETEVEIVVEEVKAASRHQAEAEVESRSRKEASRGFDLSRGPLMRVRLMKVEEQESVMVVVMHHIVSDGWSVGVLIREMGVLYGAYERGEETALEELPIQYGDYAAWQRNWVTGVFEEQLAYWREQLAGSKAVLDLPTDRPRPAIESYRGGAVAFTISPSVYESLKKLSRREGTTLFMTLAAAFDVLLHRYTGQTDLSLGTPIAGRRHSELEGLIGLFVNTVVLRLNLSDDPTFCHLLARAREAALGAYAHQDVPFERLIDELGVERSLSHSPLFQVMFALNNTPRHQFEFSGLNATSVLLDTGAVKFDLLLAMEEIGDGLIGAVQYKTDLFDAGTIERLVGNFQTLLEAIVASPASHVSSLRLLSETEQQNLLIDWNNTSATRSGVECLHHLFEQQTDQKPDSIALIINDQKLSYGELNARANQLSRYLRGLGVGPEVQVGICLSRSAEMVIAVLGVLKAGGAYVSLDPAYPQQRLRVMVEDAGLRVVLTERRLQHLLPIGPQHIICLEDPIDPDLAAQGAVGSANARALIGNLAYIIYTSGSTGIPKGVAITHGSAVALVEWALSSYTPQQLSGVLASTSLNFDLSIFELFAPLSCGGQVVLAENALELATLEARSEVTLVNTVPSAMRELVRMAGVPPTVKVVNLAGEPLRQDLVKQLYEEVGVALVYDLYGPSEDTTYSTFVLRESDGVETIGRPITNTQTYILDERLQPVPIGVAGELYIGGDGLARGYHGRPTQTAERFIPDMLSGKAGARLYGTGDLARYLPDGNIVFLGRLDHQVKIRGYRIELGEIESVLIEQETVGEAVVLARGETGQSQLVAYLVLIPGAISDLEQLRRYLRQRLPEYMIPSAIVILEALPLSPNGKVDRKALPAPSMIAAHGQPSSDKPYNQIEELLAGIWAEVLGVEEVGLKENFFDLGGHSLLATRVVSRIRQVFNTEVALRALFEHPTISELASLLHQQWQATAPDEPTLRIQPAARGEQLQPSYGQERMWFLWKLQEGSAAYNVAGAVRLIGKLDEEALVRAIKEVVRRHEVLRTRYEDRDGKPEPVVGEETEVEIVVEEVKAASRHQAEAEVESRSRKEASRGFDLSRGPLMRVRLMKVEQGESVMVVVMHHIVSDGWSVGVLIKEMGVLYGAYERGEEEALEELPIQYGDYAAWQRRWMQSSEMERQLNYWKSQLGGERAVAKLPTEKTRPARVSLKGASRKIELSAELTRKVKEVSRSQSATIYIVMMAALKVMMYRYSGEEQIAVGTVIANRMREETEGLIGFFVNTLVMKTDLGGNPSLREVIRREREVALGAYANQEIPFEKVVEEMQPERRGSETPMFEVMFVLQNTADERMEMGGVRVIEEKIEREMTKFDLTLEMREVEGKLKGAFEYSTDIFDAASIEQVAAHFERILEQLAVDSDQKINQVAMLTEWEREQIIKEWNDTKEDYARDVCVQELIEREAKQRPEAVAVSRGDEQISYEELNRKANQLAGYLKEKGVGPEVLVGILVERSIEMVIGMLGVLKAGGAYVPLEATYPGERLAFMAEDSGMKVVLTSEKLEGCVERQRARIVRLERDWEIISRYSSENQPREVSPENLAYVIYTSGSTGRPKGVELTHRGLMNLVSWYQRAYEITANDRTSQLAAMGFDASVFELWPCLSAGASVHIVEDQTRVDVEKLIEWLNKKEITIGFLPTPIAEILMGEESAKRLKMRALLVAGDTLHRSAEEGVRFRLINHYGPTENTVAATCTEVKAGVEGAPAIGKPITNTEAYVLDRNEEPVAIGVIGELYLGGESLGRGYLRRAEMTAEKFIPNQFSEKGGERLYRSGDLVRYGRNGEIEFVGRSDDQVKIRGMRIEMGEIEGVIRGHGAVKEAAVETIKGERGEKRIVAYVVGREEGKLEMREVEREVRRKLPEYMMPVAFVEMERLPLTPNGKVDRKALAEVEIRWREESNRQEEVRTPVEELLAGIWAEVLGVEEVGLKENFFDLGGHSLLATRVVSRIRQVFNTEVELRSLFEHPTIAELARYILSSSADQPETPPLKPVIRNADLPLSFAQQRLWFINRLEPDSPAYHIAGGVRLSGMLNIKALKYALTEIVRRHEALRTRFTDVEGIPVQVIDADAQVSVPVVDLSELTRAELRERVIRGLLQEEAQRPFDLWNGPLLRVLLLATSEREHILAITMHHIASDGWSMGVFNRELVALYNAYTQGVAPTLYELPIQYADYAVWQRQWLQGEALETQLNFWKKQLAGVQPLALFTDRPRPPMQTYSGAREPLAFDNAFTNKLREVSRREGVTFFMTMLAAFQFLLSRYSGQDDIAVGTPIAGRTQAEQEHLIGMFVNTLVMRTRVEGHLSFRELLRRVRETALSAYAHQDVPFEKLIEAIQPARDPSRNPLVQTMFIFNQPGESLRIQDLTLEPLTHDPGTAKLDITLALVESESELAGCIEFNTDLFDRETVVRMCAQFRVLLEAIVADPAARVSSLPLIDDAERNQVLINWNSTEANYREGQSIHTLFESQVIATPDVVAVSDGDDDITYDELNRRANQLARYLERLGIRSEVPVAICLPRSVDLIVALLGVLKSGGCYVPMDLSLPLERMKFMLADSGARLLLTHDSLKPDLPSDGINVVGLDSERRFIAMQSDENLPANTGDDSLMYVIYTSGSTGRPKAVLGTHRGAINRFRWMWNQFPFTETDVCCLKTSLSFVDCVWECFGPLLSGVRTIVIPDHVVTDAEAFITLLAQEKVTRIVLVPSLLDSFISSYPDLESLLPALTLWISSGEPLSVRLVEAFASAKPDGMLINLYGCSEIAADVTWHLCTERLDAKSVPIGRPLANTQVYILDANLNVTAVGIPGEIYVGGFGLARGYLACPDATAERFLPNPFSHRGGERLYKTGDLGRYLPNGDIEYFGRADHQVKLRGYRIESEEVERALADHPSVGQVLVMMSGESVSEKRLVAYVVAAEATHISKRELHDHAARLLPSYMVPSAFVIVDALPLLPNGKIDRNALPKVDRTHTLSASVDREPATFLERSLVSIWQEVLGLETVGVNDNFFDLGGHSLALLRVKAKIQSKTGKEISLADLFTYPTVSALSRRLTDESPASDVVATARKRSAAGHEALQRKKQRHIERGAAD